MRHFELSVDEIRTLQQRIRETKDLREFRRLQAILMVSEGAEVRKVAANLGVTVQSVYNWLNRYEKYRHPSSMQEGQHPGRPPRKSKHADVLLKDLLVTKPHEHGYRFAVWTSKLIRDHLKQKHELHISKSTVRRCLRRLHYRCKRPGYALSRCSPTWRQAKGG